MKNERIEILGKIPHDCYVALSGGPDSMAIINFLSRGRKNVTALHYNHGTDHGRKAERFVRNYCDNTGVPLHVGSINNFRDKNAGESPEEYWRKARYEFFRAFSDKPIIMGHNLDDEIENFLFTSIRNGAPSLIPYSRKVYEALVIRPFILTKKSVLEQWCVDKKVPFVVDPGNSDPKHTRSFIRHSLVPQALTVNPGLYKVIKKQLLEVW